MTVVVNAGCQPSSLVARYLKTKQVSLDATELCVVLRLRGLTSQQISAALNEIPLRTPEGREYAPHLV